MWSLRLSATKVPRDVNLASSLSGLRESLRSPNGAIGICLLDLRNVLATESSVLRDANSHPVYSSLGRRLKVDNAYYSPHMLAVHVFRGGDSLTIRLVSLNELPEKGNRLLNLGTYFKNK